MKKPDLLILIAVWEFLTAVGALFGVVAIGVLAFPAVLGMWGDALVGGAFGLSVATLVLLTLCALSVAAGVGLLLGKEWGRIAAIVHSALSVLCVPIGTVVGVLALVYLTKQEVREYFQQTTGQ